MNKVGRSVAANLVLPLVPVSAGGKAPSRAEGHDHNPALTQTSTTSLLLLSRLLMMA